MKIAKILVTIIGISFFAFLAIFTTIQVKNIDKNGVKYNGWLRVKGADIINSHNAPVQLIGVSSHGLQWDEDNLYSKENLEHLKKDLGINVFRIALYTNPDQDGFIKNPELKDKVYELIDECIRLDIYAIVDWHILEDNNPHTYETEARDFFLELSEKYKETPNVIYEICNEPNGDTDWVKDIIPYAHNVIMDIRQNNKKALIIVGTPYWSTDLVSAARYPLEDNNVVYALHFYAGSHNITLRDQIDAFREKGLAVFVSECGATDATGDGKLYNEAFQRWTDYMKEKKISWVYWSYSAKAESSAMLSAKTDFSEGKRIQDYLSESGKIFEENIQRTRE